MQPTPHGAYLTQLSQFWFINQYLVQEVDGLTLIDTGAVSQAPAILKAAASLGAPIGTPLALDQKDVQHASKATI